MQIQDVVKLLQAAIEASLYVAPRDFGLTYAELVEVGDQLGLKEGEITDALGYPNALEFTPQRRRLTLPDHLWQHYGMLVFGEDPELRNPLAFDFVVKQLNEIGREFGVGRAVLLREVMMARAQDASIPRKDLEVALALMLLSGLLVEDGDGIRFRTAVPGERQLPSFGMNQTGADRIRHRKVERTRAMPLVKDVIDRRTDGRPASAEPFEAFEECLSSLGYANFKLWWAQTAAELKRSDHISSPLSSLVLSAALVEGSLTFIVKHAQRLGLSVFGSTDLTKDPKTWKLEDLVSGATRGGDAAVLDAQLRNRVDGLLINGVPDLRPEEARDARGVAELVVRRILEWLEKFPPS
jgi:hypothetical protein